MAQTAAGASAWKWRDANGQINVSDLPPPASIPLKDILERPPSSARWRRTGGRSLHGTRAAGHLDASAPTPNSKRAANARSTSRPASSASSRSATPPCAPRIARARSALARSTDGQRITRTNAQGEREVLDDKGRAEEMQRARTVIASDCR